MGKCIENIQSQYVRLRPRLRFNQEIMDNIIYKGLSFSAHRIIRGDKMDLSIRNMLDSKMNRGLPPSAI